MNMFMYAAFWVLLFIFFKLCFFGWIPRNITWSKGINMPFECILPNCFPRGINWFLFPSFWFYKLQFTLLPNECWPCLALTYCRLTEKTVAERDGCSLLCKYIPAVPMLLRTQSTWELRGRAPASLVEKWFSVSRESRLGSLVESHASPDPQLTEV